jgi:hypothetical protein
MRCGLQTNVQDVAPHSLHDSHARALAHNEDGNGVLCGTSNMDDSGDTNTYDPNTSDALCNGMDATILANTPSNMANANIPMMVPRTNHRYMDDRYILAQ